MSGFLTFSGGTEMQNLHGNGLIPTITRLLILRSPPNREPATAKVIKQDTFSSKTALLTT